MSCYTSKAYKCIENKCSCNYEFEKRSKRIFIFIKYCIKYYKKNKSLQRKSRHKYQKFLKRESRHGLLRVNLSEKFTERLDILDKFLRPQDKDQGQCLKEEQPGSDHDRDCEHEEKYF